jgi:hypothetical protein
VVCQEIFCLWFAKIPCHDRWRVVDFNVTEHPTALWAGQQTVQAFPEDTAPRYPLRDQNQMDGASFQERVSGTEVEEILTAPQSPWQSPWSKDGSGRSGVTVWIMRSSLGNSTYGGA